MSFIKETRKLKITNFFYFTRIVEEKSISKVAKKEHISQSALTQIVKKLEEDFGSSLLYRSNRGVTVTESGKIVYDYALSIISTYEYMKQRLYCLECECYDVIIKPCYTLNNYLVPKMLFEIQNEYKNIKFNINADCKKNILTEVENKICDFGLVMGTVNKNPALDISLIGYETIVLVSGINYDVDNKISIDKLNSFEIIEFNLGSYSSEIRKTINKTEIYKEKLTLKNPDFKIDSIPAIKNLLEANIGVSFLPYSCVSDEIIKSKLKKIDIDDFTMKLPVSLVSQYDKNLTTLNLSLKKKFKENIVKIVNVR